MEKNLIKMLSESKTLDDFKKCYIEDYNPRKEDNNYSELDYYIEQDVIATCIWFGRKDILRKEKLKRLIK